MACASEDAELLNLLLEDELETALRDLDAILPDAEAAQYTYGRVAGLHQAREIVFQIIKSKEAGKEIGR